MCDRAGAPAYIHTKGLNMANTKIRKNRLASPAGLTDRKVRLIAVQVLFMIGVSLILAMLVRLVSLDNVSGAEDIFNGKVWLQILILTVIMAIIMSTLLLYAYYVRKDADDSKHKLLPVLATSVTLTFALALVFGRLISLYSAPLTLCSLLVAALIDKRVGVVTNILISQAFYLTYVFVFGSAKVVESSAALITSMVASIFLIVFIDKADNRLKFTLTGFVVGICTAVLPILINLVIDASDAAVVLMSGLWSFVSVVLSIGLFMIILPVMEFLFRLDTGFRLAELCSLDNPLLKRLAQEAPGTFNHSMVVGNLAELCADAIGENSQLAKVCAYYHDVGKTKNPQYFIENQKGYNPHDDVIPEVSVSMIVSHVTEGSAMLRKERLPDIVADVALQHHGTTPVNYFLYKAQNFTEDDLDKAGFSYPGPKPQTKIAAIIMIADTAEAASRAVSGLKTPESYRAFVHNIIKQKADSDQFSECAITYKDLQIIEDTLATAIPSIYHGRIEYNNNRKDK